MYHLVALQYVVAMRLLSPLRHLAVSMHHQHDGRPISTSRGAQRSYVSFAGASQCGCLVPSPLACSIFPCPRTVSPAQTNTINFATRHLAITGSTSQLPFSHCGYRVVAWRLHFQVMPDRFESHAQLAKNHHNRLVIQYLGYRISRPEGGMSCSLALHHVVAFGLYSHFLARSISPFPCTVRETNTHPL